MNLILLSDSVKFFIPKQIICLSYKFFTQFILKDQLVAELKTYLPQILDQVVKGSLLTSSDIDNFKNVLTFIVFI